MAYLLLVREACPEGRENYSKWLLSMRSDDDCVGGGQMARPGSPGPWNRSPAAVPQSIFRALQLPEFSIDILPLV